MIPSPLQLERHFFTKIQVDAHRDGDPGAKVELRSEVEVSRAAHDTQRYQLTLRLKLLPSTDKKSHYTAEIHVIGLMRVANNGSEAKALQLVQANGAALLYGAAREMLCNITARGPWPMLCLNAVTFAQPTPPLSPQPSDAAAGPAKR